MSDMLSRYRLMRRIRVVEETLMQLKSGGEIPGSIHLCNGQEAIPVGVAEALRPDDFVATTYRGHGWAIARGVDPAALIAELMGRDSALCGGRAGSPYFSDRQHNFIGENSIVAAGLPIALGAALSAARLGTDRVCVVSIGDGALNQGAAHEALNMAAVLQAPLVVIVENNIYSEMSLIQDMVRIDQLSERGPAYGIPAQCVDGNDPPKVAEAAHEAVSRARAGAGPTLIEAMTERLVGHYSGDSQHYRPKGELADAMEREPLRRARDALLGQADMLQALDTIDHEVAAEVDAAVEQARSVQFPPAESALEHVYV